MNIPKPLNRKELAAFLPDQRSIKAFEQLFENAPAQAEAIETEVADSVAKSNQNTAISLEALELARSSNVLSWLNTH